MTFRVQLRQISPVDSCIGSVIEPLSLPTPALTVPVIVVLLVAVTVQVQVGAAGQVETEMRQQVSEISPQQSARLFSVASRSPPSRRMRWGFIFSSFTGRKSVEDMSHKWLNIREEEMKHWEAGD